MKKTLLLVVNIIIFLLMTKFSFAVDSSNLFHQFESNTPPVFPSCPALPLIDRSKSHISLNKLKPVAVLQANSVDGIVGGEHYAVGNVVGRFDDDTVTAKWLGYDQESKHITAGGNVVLTRQYDVISGKWINYYFDLNKGEIVDATAFEHNSNLYAKGARIKIFDKNHYQIQRGFFTSCNPDNPDWHIEVKQVNFNYQNNQGNARSAVFYAKKLPIAYLPYFPFPLGRRQSGILTPDIGFINSGGFFVGVPYYWNIAPNYDMTFTPYIYSMLGPLFKNEFRYMQDSGSGLIYTEQLPGFGKNKYQYYWHFKDDRAFDEGKLKFGYDYNKVSNDNYFNTLGGFNSTTSSVNLSQTAYANYTPDWGDLAIRVQGYQVLSIPGTTAPDIYSLLPQIYLNTNSLQVFDSRLRFKAQTSYSNFYSHSLQSGKRLALYPSLNLPLTSSWGFINPKLGYNYVNYQLDSFKNTKSKQITRALPIASLDSGLIFTRDISLFKTKYQQTLEPRLYYLYIPTVDQSNILLFDTALNTPSLNNLFSENRFSGVDRINSANDVTLGVTSKLINQANGSYFANWGVGYRMKLTPEDLSKYGSAEQYPLFRQNSNPNLIAELNNQWTNNFSTYVNYQYSVDHYNAANLYALQMQYKTYNNTIFNARYSYQAQMPLIYYNWIPGQVFNPSQFEDQRAIDLSTRVPVINNKLYAEGRINYDLTSGSTINVIAGLQYLSDCWSLNFVYENYRVGPAQTQNAYSLQFNLNGLTSFGSNPDMELINNIPGYVPITKIY